MSQQNQEKNKNQSQEALTEPAGGSMQSNNLLGCKISIQTGVGVRYEGTLSEVDPTKKSMTLVNVKSFGTEGRRQNNNEIPARDQEIPEVQFKLDHIKDFQIISKPDVTQLDPAIQAVNYEAKAKKENKADSGKGGPEKHQQNEKQGSNYYKQDSKEDYYEGGGRGRGRGGRGGYQYQQKKNLGEFEKNPNERLQEKLKDNFDFEQHKIKDENSKEEDKNDQESTETEQQQEKTSKYDKKVDFFDMISNSTQKKDKEQQNREEIRRKDAETFGQQSSSNFQYQGSSRGGRGRGGRGDRGGYRGRGDRGGYHGGGRGQNYYDKEGGSYSQRPRYEEQEQYSGWENYSHKDNYRGRGRGGRGRGGQEGGYNNQYNDRPYKSHENFDKSEKDEEGFYQVKRGGPRGGRGDRGGYRGRGDRGGGGYYQKKEEF